MAGATTVVKAEPATGVVTLSIQWTTTMAKRTLPIGAMFSYFSAYLAGFVDSAPPQPVLSFIGM